jgi:serine/threonine protein kinase
MTETRRCPQCGTELPPDSPQGICPNCVFQMGLGSTPEADPGGETGDPRHSVKGESAAVPLPVPHGRSQQATVVGGAFVPPAADELAKLFPQLEILELLGRGGMGVVYRARQPTLYRMVAVKILPPTVAADPTFAERFTREARALARLNHPHIVSVYDFGQVQGLFYFVMEYVDGANLRTAIQAARLNAQEALAIVPQICEALQYAHDEGVVHRDIKPENILIDKRGRVKIADFGLAKIVGQGSAGDSDSPPKRDFTLTGTHQVMGTMHYMAPEQIEKPQTVDHRADIYSLGVVFYEMLTGELPIGRFAPPSHKVRMDVRLDEVVLRSLEKEPDRRYQHASDVKLEVETIGRDPVPPPVPAAIPESQSDRQEPAVDLESARRQVKGPAIGLILAGSFNLISLALTLLAAAWGIGFIPVSRTELHASDERFLQLPVAPPGSNRFGAPLCAVPILAAHFGLDLVLAQAASEQPPAKLLWAVAMATIVAIWVAVGIFTIIGAIKMRRLELYPLVVIATVTAMLPWSPGCLIGLPCGIWALVVLSRAEIRVAFKRIRQHG